MTAIPSLRLDSGLRPYPTPPSSAASSARKRVRDVQSGGALALSARHIVKPQVGITAMLSALGDLKPSWEKHSQKVGTPRTPRSFSLVPPEPPMPDTRPYHVGRARARGQLRLALETRDESAQLRRLEHALGSPVVHDDREIAREVERAEDVAYTLAHRLRAAADDSMTWNELAAVGDATGAAAHAAAAKAANKAAEIAMAAEEDEEEGIAEDGNQEDGNHEDGNQEDGNQEADAALRIQSVYRGKKERDQVRKQHAEEEAAAVRIQSVYRGKSARNHNNDESN